MTSELNPDNLMFDLVDSLDETVALLAPDGTVLMINESGAGQFGRTRDSVVGRCVYDMLPPEVVDHRRRIAADVLRSGEPVTFTDELNGRYLEHRVCPIRDDAGRVTRLAIHIADVTARVQSEQQRLAKSNELETIHAQVPVGILLLDAERRVTKANRAVARMAGVPREDVINRVGGAALGCLNHLDDERGCGYGPDCAACELRLAVRGVLEDGTVTYCPFGAWPIGYLHWGFAELNEIHERMAKVWISSCVRC